MDQVHRSKERLLESSFVSSLAADRRPHYDFAAALPLGVIESQPLVWPNLASSSHPCALAYLIAGRISPSFNPVSAATRLILFSGATGFPLSIRALRSRLALAGAFWLAIASL
jgi:hypothetical protein